MLAGGPRTTIRGPPRTSRWHASVGITFRFLFQVIGNVDLLPTSLVLAVKEAERESQNGEWQFNLAVEYGGPQEIVDACRSLVTELQGAGVSEQELAETYRRCWTPPTPLYK